MAMQRSTMSFLILAAVAGTAIASPGAMAQSAAVRPGVDLRPLYATPSDVPDGKRLAESTCRNCHNVNGISTTPNTPHLAGQRPAYLYLELKAYQSGGRGNSAMNAAVKFLSDDALVKVAAYYASLDPAPAPTAAPPPAKPDAVQAGKTLANAACAGNAGVSQIPGMPSLIGFDPKYSVEAMKAYKNGQRKHDTMKSMLASVNDAALTNLALFYALQPAARAKTPVSGDAAAGKNAAASCGGCHGDLGVSGRPATPGLAGQDTQYLVVALQAYKSGARADQTMKGLVASLDDNTMKNMAAFYATQEPKAPNGRKQPTTEEWQQDWSRCP